MSKYWGCLPAVLVLGALVGSGFYSSHLVSRGRADAVVERRGQVADQEIELNPVAFRVPAGFEPIRRGLIVDKADSVEWSGIGARIRVRLGQYANERSQGLANRYAAEIEIVVLASDVDGPAPDWPEDSQWRRGPQEETKLSGRGGRQLVAMRTRPELYPSEQAREIVRQVYSSLRLDQAAIDRGAAAWRAEFETADMPTRRIERILAEELGVAFEGVRPSAISTSESGHQIRPGQSETGHFFHSGRVFINCWSALTREQIEHARSGLGPIMQETSEMKTGFYHYRQALAVWPGIGASDTTVEVLWTEEGDEEGPGTDTPTPYSMTRRLGDLEYPNGRLYVSDSSYHFGRDADAVRLRRFIADARAACPNLP